MTAFAEIKLGDVLTLQRGFDITKDEQTAGSVPIVSSSGVSSYHNQAKAIAPGVVIGREGTLGTVHFLNVPYWPHDTSLWIKDFKGNDARFIYFFLQTLKLQNFDVGASNPTLNRNHVHRIKVFFPTTVETQRNIAAILTAYDDLIEANQRRIALLERMAEEIYREWFVRLRFPGHEKTKLTKGVPAGWRNGRFGQFCRLKRGYDLPDAEIVAGPYPVIASTSIKAFHAEFKVEPPVITTGRSGSLGEVLMVNQRAWPLNTALYVKEFFGNSPFLIFYTLRNMDLENFNAGAGVPTLNRNHLEGLRLVIPPPSLQARFDEVVGPLHRQADALRVANQILTRTRDALLPRLISGKLRVDDLAIQFPPSMAADAAG